MEVVAVMDVEIPPADVGYAHVVAAQLGRLHFPDDIRARDVFEANLYRCCRHSVNALPAIFFSIDFRQIHARSSYIYINLKHFIQTTNLIAS